MKIYCNLDSILCARENGITLVIFLPLCSHRLQLLDVGVRRSFKYKLCVARHDWMTANHGKVIAVLHLTSLKNATIKLLLLRRI
jgi:hypothetical protein